MNTIGADWQRFWFRPTVATCVGLRVTTCSLVAIWWASFWTELPFWFGANGVLNRATAAKLVAYEEIASWQLLSPLWLVDNILFFQGYVVTGIALAISCAVGVGSPRVHRWMLGALLVMVLGWTHRIGWLMGPVEPVLVAYLAYLMLDSGVGRNQGSAGNPNNWRSNSVHRLFQVHAWGLLAAGLASQLASLIWWRGEAVWWLVAAGRSNLIPSKGLVNQALWVNALTHGMILVQLLALWLLVIRSTRLIGMVFALLACASLACLADQTLYALTIAVGITAFAAYRQTNPESA